MGDAQKEMEMKNLITCLVVCVMSSATFADTWTVDDDGKADFSNIQAAVDAALDGDEIIVMPGTYTGSGAEVVNMLGKEVWLHSSKGAQVTIIDAGNVRRGIYCNGGETSNTIIEGFTITNGYHSYGGGMYSRNSSPTLIGCTFTINNAYQGGGMLNDLYSNSTLTDCTFENNTADYGAGMYNYGENHTLTNCSFTNNNAGQGGGMYNNNSNPTLSYCTFTGNTAGNGGGIYSDDTYYPTLMNCTLCSNTVNQIYGNWTDEGGNTVTAICPVPGACCTNDNCIVSEQEDCGTFFGQWLGEGTTCEDNPCPTSCLGDVTGDGQVDVTDILVVISVWGACP
jgi:predicted outer membrane repeat protein